MVECVVDVGFWSSVIVGTLVLFFAGWFIGWLKYKWVCRDDSLMRLPIHIGNCSFKGIDHFTLGGKKQLVIYLVNEEGKGCMTVSCENADKIIVDQYVPGDPGRWECKEL